MHCAFASHTSIILYLPRSLHEIGLLVLLPVRALLMWINALSPKPYQKKKNQFFLMRMASPSNLALKSQFCLQDFVGRSLFYHRSLLVLLKFVKNWHLDITFVTSKLLVCMYAHVSITLSYTELYGHFSQLKVQDFLLCALASCARLMCMKYWLEKSSVGECPGLETQGGSHLSNTAFQIAWPWCGLVMKLTVLRVGPSSTINACTLYNEHVW